MSSLENPLQPGCTYTLKTPGLFIQGNPVDSFLYNPVDPYPFETFDAIDDWLKTNALEIDNSPIAYFERDSEGRLLAVFQTPIEKEAAVAEIARQLANWNLLTAQNGIITSSQGGFLLDYGVVRAPDVAFTPHTTVSSLTQEQRLSFRGEPFSPLFVVEVDDLTNQAKLDSLTAKIKETFIPSGVQLAWLIDATHHLFFSFKATTTGKVRRSEHSWLDKDGNPAVVRGGNILPGFYLELSEIEAAISSNTVSSDQRTACPHCDKKFFKKYTFIRHFSSKH